MAPISILLVESHARLRRGIRKLLETDPALQVISEASDASEAVRLADEHAPEIIVTEIMLRGGSGIEAAAQISTRRPQIGIVFLSMYSDIAYVVSSLKAGGRGYVLKDTANQDLSDAIHVVRHGSIFHSPAVTELLAQDCVRKLRGRHEGALLSTREAELIEFLAQGQTCRDAELLLGRSQTAAEADWFEALRKMYLQDSETRVRPRFA